ncbi:MAG: peptidoglycan-associated lipoprotein Pal [Planktomarina sp.]|jgi:peptidoglycan-associated lipoprotein|nr:peptidoglycan-associated lipoprotein Pal [Planktomarina sp.]MDT2056561.1 peptidoglycan-associated lipoprotein Pal [Planktomarina sp.]|tara:strand:- start:455 stop:964 length:510 start_codon:yes stop_codon:yes gene_type:complete
MRLIHLAFVPFLALVACTDPEGGFNGGLLGDSSSWDDPAANAEDQSDPTSQAFFEKKIGNRVLFEINKYTLSSSAKAGLDEQARWLIDNPQYVIIIEGHADEQGTREYNLALGFRRAQSAQEYLVSRGVSGLRLKTRSYGKERPLEICSAERCYAKNRRSVTLLTAGLS